MGLLVDNSDSWVLAGELPSPRSALKGVNIDNRVIMTGGSGSDWLDEILEFSADTGDWRLVGRMSEARAHHAASTVMAATYSDVTIRNYEEQRFLKKYTNKQE